MSVRDLRCKAVAHQRIKHSKNGNLCTLRQSQSEWWVDSSLDFHFSPAIMRQVTEGKSGGFKMGIYSVDRTHASTGGTNDKEFHSLNWTAAVARLH